MRFSISLRDAGTGSTIKTKLDNSLEFRLILNAFTVGAEPNRVRDHCQPAQVNLVGLVLFDAANKRRVNFYVIQSQIMQLANLCNLVTDMLDTDSTACC